MRNYDVKKNGKFKLWSSNKKILAIHFCLKDGGGIKYRNFKALKKTFKKKCLSEIDVRCLNQNRKHESGQSNEIQK